MSYKTYHDWFMVHSKPMTKCPSSEKPKTESCPSQSAPKTEKPKEKKVKGDNNYERWT